MALISDKMGLEAEKQVSGILSFDVAGGLLCEAEEYERAVLTFQNVSGETVSAMKVGVVFAQTRRQLASHLLMNAERLSECHDFKTEVINFTRARVAAAGACSSNSGIQHMVVGGHGSRICHNNRTLGRLMKDGWSGYGKDTGGKGKGKKRVGQWQQEHGNQGLTWNAINCWNVGNVVTTHEIAEASQSLEKVRLRLNAQQWVDQQVVGEVKAGSPIGGLWLCSFVIS